MTENITGAWCHITARLASPTHIALSDAFHQDMMSPSPEIFPPEIFPPEIVSPLIASWPAGCDGWTVQNIGAYPPVRASPNPWFSRRFHRSTGQLRRIGRPNPSELRGPVSALFSSFPIFRNWFTLVLYSHCAVPGQRPTVHQTVALHRHASYKPPKREKKRQKSPAQQPSGPFVPEPRTAANRNPRGKLRRAWFKWCACMRLRDLT